MAQLREAKTERPVAVPERPLHILHGVLSLGVGGLERIVLDLVRTGVRQGHRVSVLCVEGPGQLASQVEEAGATVVSLGKPPGRIAQYADRASEAVARLKPDVIHTHQIGATWYVGPGAGRLGVPVLHTEHIDNVSKANGVWAQLKVRLLWHQAAKHVGLFCGVSEDVSRSAGRWGTVPRSKIVTLLNGIDTDRYDDREHRREVRDSLGIPRSARVVGTVGRLNEVKRQDLLLDGIAGLGADFDDVHVLLVGDGLERGALERRSRELGLGERVHFAGYQSAPERFLAAMDVFALTSRLEGLPLAMLEAWASGLPVVSSAVGGIPAVVEDGVSGLLFPSGNVPALTDALRATLTDSELAGRLAGAGRERARADYSLSRMARDYEQHYRTLIARNAGGRAAAHDNRH